MLSVGTEQVREAVTAAMPRADVRKAVEELYAETELELSRIRPRCEMSGRCCRFEEYGHRLFVTTAEMATFAVAVGAVAQTAPYLGREDGGGCRFQEMELCRAHGIRPMGCRLFFCDDSHERELQVLFERMHSRLKQIHERFAVTYYYVEWRQALQVIGQLAREC